MTEASKNLEAALSLQSTYSFENLLLLESLADSYLSAEKLDLLGLALYVEKNLNTKNQQTNKPVRFSVHINLEELGSQINYLKELLKNANSVGKNLSSVIATKIEGFALAVAGINIIQKKITNNGKVELPANELCSIHQENGRKLARLSGKGIMQLAKYAETDIHTMNEHMRFTTSRVSDTKDLEQRLIILFLYVINVIDGYIPNEILNKNTLSIEFRIKHGWTKYGLFDGEVKEISDTQRYKCLGNAVTTNVIRDILLRWG